VKIWEYLRWGEAVSRGGGSVWTEGEKILQILREYNEELHNLYFLSNIEMIRSRRMSRVGHLTYRREVHIKFLLENLKSTNLF
jgi:hypothetical protein